VAESSPDRRCALGDCIYQSTIRGRRNGRRDFSTVDGTSWSTIVSSTRERLNGIVFANGLYVAVGDAGTIITSHNSVNWTKRYSGTNVSIFGVTYGNGTFIVVGLSGTILSSTNGIDWEEVTSNSTDRLTSFLLKINLWRLALEAQS
jgi:hypothetical protein